MRGRSGEIRSEMEVVEGLKTSRCGVGGKGKPPSRSSSAEVYEQVERGEGRTGVYGCRGGRGRRPGVAGGRGAREGALPAELNEAVRTQLAKRSSSAAIFAAVDAAPTASEPSARVESVEDVAEGGTLVPCESARLASDFALSGTSSSAWPVAVTTLGVGLVPLRNCC